ncbi:SGNH/GDSL hydrolase family protein [Nonomuraea zeae]|uniref:SGNH/GDSL hydrolase family protein n=1 Tax=Nonomuraea zeae TaxID=1642303 RepID=A0A5S4GW85_9ACTN|nr:SGNH/GDSL hydrolase family protein [Nonomuraea zeae]TMR37216.1 SGNH/GDSL hydrolase family protein [Nonomuraea zeae]
MRARCWLIVVVSVLVWGLPAPASAVAGPRVLYVGDSLAVETTNMTGWWVQAPGDAEFRAEAFGAMNICDFLTGVSGWIGPDRKLGALVQSYRPAAVALQFWGNPRWLSTCTAQRADNQTFYDAIDRDAERAVAEIAFAAASAGMARPRIVWVLQQPDRDNPNIPRRLNGIYAAKAAKYGDLTSDAGRELSMAAYPYPIPPEQKDRYAWTQFLPCSDLERQLGYCTHPQTYGGVTKLHQDNDPVHFCLGESAPGGCTVNSPSILRYSMAVAATARQAIGVDASLSRVPSPAVPR